MGPCIIMLCVVAQTCWVYESTSLNCVTLEVSIIIFVSYAVALQAHALRNFTRVLLENTIPKYMVYKDKEEQRAIKVS